MVLTNSMLEKKKGISNSSIGVITDNDDMQAAFPTRDGIQVWQASSDWAPHFLQKLNSTRYPRPQGCLQRSNLTEQNTGGGSCLFSIRSLSPSTRRRAFPCHPLPLH